MEHEFGDIILVTEVHNSRELSMISHKFSKVAFLVLVALFGAQPAVTQTAAEFEVPACTFSATEPDIYCMYLPDTDATGTMGSTTIGGMSKSVLDYDIWAWNSFIAMNWPVKKESGNVVRGIPSSSSSFSTAASNELTVWESLKEKREIFLFDTTAGKIVDDPQPAAWNADPSYGGVDIPACSAADEPAKGEFVRVVTQSRKLVFNTLDETAEVASEARESQASLCAGFPAGNLPLGCKSGGLGTPQIHKSPVGPRVWYGQPGGTNKTANVTPVVYEVKVNWDFYNYLGNFELPATLKTSSQTGKTPLWVQNNAALAAKDGLIRLPIRTSASKIPPRPGTGGTEEGLQATGNQNSTGVTSYRAVSCASIESLTGLPCPAGSVHLKAAWIDLDEAGISMADQAGYHTTTGYTYKNQQTGTSPVCKQKKTLGLVGLHIIQRIHENAQGNKSNNPPTPGGTFVFATFEHNKNDSAGENGNPTRFSYANLYPATTGDTPKTYPNVSDSTAAFPLYRYYKVLDTTENANAAVYDKLDCAGSSPSVWCNYKLIGTQYAAADVKSETLNYDKLPSTQQANPTNATGQPQYLANLVIETNLGLQQFQGLPPAIVPISHYQSPEFPPGANNMTGGTGVIGNQSPGYVTSADNVAYRIAPTSGGTNKNANGAVNMGGCMGCHGVAQQLGYAFSFVLLGNQMGAGVDSQTNVEIPPRPNAIVPTGSYQLTCNGCSTSNSTGTDMLNCDVCYKADGFTPNKTSIAYTFCKRDGINNIDGSLMCDDPYPPGSYQSNCSNCTLDAATNTVKCDCEKTVSLQPSGQALLEQATSLDIDTCKAAPDNTVSNKSGILTCDNLKPVSAGSAAASASKAMMN